MDNDSGVFIRVRSCLCSDGVFLTAQRFPHVDVAALKDNHGISEYEILGAVYVTVTIELAL